jgi:hypothetical protein
VRHEVGHQQRQVFPHAACVVTLVDGLVHRADVIEIEADSYRLEEAKELRAARTKHAAPRGPDPAPSAPTSPVKTRLGCRGSALHR